MKKLVPAIAMLLTAALSAADLTLYTPENIKKSNVFGNIKMEQTQAGEKTAVKLIFGGVNNSPSGTFQTFQMPKVENPAEYDALKLTLSGNADCLIVLLNTDKPYCYKSRAWEPGAILRLKDRGTVTVILPLADFVHPFRNEALPKPDLTALQNIQLTVSGSVKLKTDVPAAEVLVQEIALTKTK